VIDFFLRNGIKSLLRLRYRIEVTGLEEVARRGTRGILFLPNHPALIDPIILMAWLNKHFAPRALADEDQMNRPVIAWLGRRARVLTIPDLAKVGTAGRDRINAALAEVVKSLQDGENWLLYPAGRAYRHYLEDLRGNSGVETILRQVPEARVVLVRTRGLWGSGFSWAKGHAPDVAGTLKHGFRSLLLNGIFFSPRRPVSIEFHEPADLPRSADRETLNRFLQDFYNQGALHNTYVPYTVWEHRAPVELPEPVWGSKERSLDSVSETTRSLVLKHLRELTGRAVVRDEDHLAHDLGLDSLARADLLLWVETEFGFAPGNPDSLETVADLLLAASGEPFIGGPAALKPVPVGWFRDRAENDRLSEPVGETITEAFLARASRTPDRVIIADQTSGARTYRDLVTAILLLRPAIKELPGETVGILMPAGVTADILYLSALFATKTPAMVNWTTGPRSIVHSLDLVGVKHILTARALVERLTSQGTDLRELADRFVFVEDLAARLSRPKKLAAWVRSRLSWAHLAAARVPERAVVLFTSGSEAAPKAVPLTHTNLLTNIRDVMDRVALRENDRIIGFLPPFHSFGLTCTVILPLCSGIRTVYHPSPTDARTLCQLIHAYRATLLLGTPTFLSGIVRAATSEQLSSLRLAVTGAEQCPDRVYAALAERCPGAKVLEGYGVTECSPIVSVNDDREPKPFTIGKPLRSVECTIVSTDDGKRVERGQPGVLLVRGPSVFGGYIGSETTSPFVELDGKTWYLTGDIVREDADGTLRFCGRLKRFVKLGGEMISLPAIEAVLEEHYSTDSDEGPSIAVEATPAEQNPELVLFTTKALDRETVNRQLREAGLSPLHNIRRVIRLDRLPVLGTGKTDYRALKRLLADKQP